MQENKHWEDSFQVYERGVALFKYPHVKNSWNAYRAQFVKRYAGTKLERARDLFRHALEMVRCSPPSGAVNALAREQPERHCDAMLA